MNRHFSLQGFFLFISFYPLVFINLNFSCLSYFDFRVLYFVLSCKNNILIFIISIIRESGTSSTTASANTYPTLRLSPRWDRYLSLPSHYLKS